MILHFTSLRTRLRAHVDGAHTLYATVLILALASASWSAMAQSYVDTNPSLYRCAVLGETQHCPQQPSRPNAWIEEWVEMGTVAKYLRYLGAEPADAIARARRLGEEPQRHVAHVSRVPLTPEQAYAQAMNQRVTSDERRETILVAPARDSDPMLHSNWSAFTPVPASGCVRPTPTNGQVPTPSQERCTPVAGKAK